MIPSRPTVWRATVFSQELGQGAMQCLLKKYGKEERAGGISQEIFLRSWRPYRHIIPSNPKYGLTRDLLESW